MFCFFFSSRRRHTRCALVTGVQTCALPIFVAAEGRHSPTREAAHINVARWGYDEVAIITAIHHEKSHENTAYEIFYPDGPFAVLPMLPGTRSAIVWTVPKKRAPAMLELNERAFVAEMHKRIGGFLGEISLAAPRSSFPLGFYHKIGRDNV